MKTIFAASNSAATGQQRAVKLFKHIAQHRSFTCNSGRSKRLGRAIMIRGSCLCGGVRFEIDRVTGPFELCHCTRCRKASGSAFLAWIAFLRTDFRLLEGAELIKTYEAPVRVRPPPYRKSFCSRCGSPVPDPSSDSPRIEVPAGVLDDDPQLRPDRHILVECKSPWFTISDALPQLDRAAIDALRGKQA